MIFTEAVVKHTINAKIPLHTDEKAVDRFFRAEPELTIFVNSVVDTIWNELTLSGQVVTR